MLLLVNIEVGLFRSSTVMHIKCLLCGQIISGWCSTTPSASYVKRFSVLQLWEDAVGGCYLYSGSGVYCFGSRIKGFVMVAR